jgi:hypothetical protein
MGRIQLFRATFGLPPELEISRATSRGGSFCQLVVKAEAELIVGDAESDRRVPQELVEQYGIRAYAGVPLRHRGRVIGSLCALDRKPRAWSESVIRELSAVAAEVVRRLDTLEEHRDREEAEAVHAQALRLMLDAVLRDLETIEEPTAQMEALLRAGAWTEPSAIGAGAAPFAGDAASRLAALYRRLDEPAGMIRRRALRVADAVELRGLPGGGEVLEALRMHARTIVRSLREIGPLARLVEGLSAGTISAEAFTRNVAVLGEAKNAVTDMRASLSGLREAAERVGESLAKRR